MDKNAARPTVHAVIPLTQRIHTYMRPSAIMRPILAMVSVLEHFLHTTLYIKISEMDSEPIYDTYIQDMQQAAYRTNLINETRYEARLPDEPFLEIYGTYVNDSRIGSGFDLSNSGAAICRALGEGIERGVLQKSKAFPGITIKNLAKNNHVVPIQSFAGYKDRTLKNTRNVMYIPGFDEVNRQEVYIPKQLFAGGDKSEPFIREANSNGLAAYYKNPTAAKVNGALEAIERDAFVISYVNGFIPHVIPHATILPKSAVAECERKQLSIHQVLLPTDFPVHVVCTILIDRTGGGPAVSVGMRAHGIFKEACLGALREALALRTFFRKEIPFAHGEPQRAPRDFMEGRAFVWSHKERVADIAPFISGNTLTHIPADTVSGNTPDANAAVLQAITSHCAKMGYTYITADIGRMYGDLHGWQVMYSVIPELQPLFFDDTNPAIFGPRIERVPFDISNIKIQKGGFKAPLPFI